WRRQVSSSTSRPNAAKASRHAALCCAALSTSVPSISSRRTVGRIPSFSPRLEGQRVLSERRDPEGAGGAIVVPVGHDTEVLLWAGLHCSSAWSGGVQ